MRTRASNMAGFTLLPVILAMSLIAAIAFLLNRDSGMNAAMVASQGDADRARYVAEAGLQAVNAIAQGKNCTGYTDLPADALLPPIAFGAGSFTATANPKAGTPVTLTATGTSSGVSASLIRANVVVLQTTPATLTLQPGTPGMDTDMSSASPNNNYGANPNISVNFGQGVALVQFDLSSIPAGSVIQSAQMSLYHTVGGNDTVSAYRVTKPWNEGTGAAGSGATWNKYNGVTAWTAAGGDYDPPPGVSIALPAINTWATWDLTSLTAARAAGTQQNYGIALAASGGGNNSFASSDNGTAANRPRLVVTFLPPCGWVPAATGVTLQASQDTWISETNMGSNYGSSISFTVTNANKRGRGLVKFNVSSIPPGTLLQSATLRLFTGSFFPKQTSILTVNRVTNNSMNNWTELGATWRRSDGTSGWSAAWGGSYDLPAAASAALSSSFTSGWVEWDVKALAQEWVDGAPNYGAFVLIDTSSAVVFNSREFTVNQPQLVITY